MKPNRLPSSIISSIIILIGLIIIISLLPVNFHEIVNNASESSDNQGAAAIGAIFVALFGIIFLYGAAIILIVVHSILLIFTLRNIKADTKGVRIWNYCLDACNVFIIVSSIVKIILWANGA